MEKKIYECIEIEFFFIRDEIVRTSPPTGGGAGETPPEGGEDLFG